MKGLRIFLIVLLVVVLGFGALAVFVLYKTGVFTDKTYDYVSYEYEPYGNYTDEQLADVQPTLDAYQANAERGVTKVMLNDVQKLKIVTNSKKLKCTSKDGKVDSFSYRPYDDGTLGFTVTTSDNFYSGTIVYTDSGIDLRIGIGSSTLTYNDKPNTKITVGLTLVMHYEVE